MRRIVPLVLTLAWLAYLWWGRLGEVGLAAWIGSGIALAGAAAAAAIPASATRAPAIVAALLMASVGGFVALRVVGHWPFAWDAMADARYAALIATLAFAIAIGLVGRRLWARWAALAFAAGSALGGTLNSIGMRGTRDDGAWLAAIGVFGSVTIWELLARPAVRERFGHALWTSRDRLVRSARWAAIANFAAAPMLVLYALGQPVAPATVYSALALAPVLGIGSALVVMRRAAGVALLAVGGLGLIAHTAATLDFCAVGSARIADYYAAFWVPAAVLGIVAGVIAFARSR